VEHHVTIRAAIGLIDFAETRGVERAGSLRVVGLNGDESDDLDRRIPLAGLQALWAYVLRETGDPGFPLKWAMSRDAAFFDVIAYLGLTSDTLGDAWRRVEKVAPVWTSAMSFSRVKEPLRFHLRLRPPGQRGATRVRAEIGLTVLLHAFGRSIARGGLNPDVVHFRHPRPVHADQYESVFRAPILFDQPHDQLVFPEDVPIRPTRSPEPRLTLYFQKEAERLVEAIQPTDFSDQVRAAISERITSGRPKIAEIARRLGVSSRTMQRRLGESGATYSDLVGDVQLDLARQYLSRKDLSVAEVAFLSGYSDPAAFHHAFRRREGITPVAWRSTASSRSR